MTIAARRIIERLVQDGHEAYFVGGCVRDMVMRRTLVDIDIATSATPDRIMQLFARTVPVGVQFGVVLVLTGEYAFEVATFRSDGEYHDGRHPATVHFSSPEQDARRRDFTVNGLFYDPLTDRLVDFVGGQVDINKKIIRAIGDPHARFTEDKLRLLRALRFAARFDFAIEKNTWQALCEQAPHIHEVSAERVRDELIKMFTDRAPGRSLELLDASGLLEEVLPEVAALKGVEQPPEFHPEGDVFVHTHLMMQLLERPDCHLAFAALLHDVGKPSTMKVADRIRFSCHDVVGAKMAEKILRRLRFPNKDIDAIVQCVRNHMNVMHVMKMREGKLKRFIASETFETELELHRIDCATSHGMLDNYHFLKEKQQAFAHVVLKPKPFITGYDLIDRGLKPGPSFRDILEEALDLQLEGTFADRDAALRWLDEKLKENKK